MSGDERLRLFLALRVPDDVLLEIEHWQSSQLPRVRLVPPAHLHVTLAFLGHRPAGELEAIVGALRAAASEAGEIRFTPIRYRETRSVGMFVLEDEGGRASVLASRLHELLEGLGVYRRERRPGCRISRSRAGGSARGCSPSSRRWERLFRPTLLLTYLDCTPVGRGTKSWNLSL